MSDDRIPVVRIRDRTIYALQPRQMEALEMTPLFREPDDSYPTHIGYGGAAGGGKSYLARVVATVAAMKWPGSTSIIFRRTRPEIRDNHIVKFLGEVPDFGGELYAFNATDGVVTWFNKSRTLFGYLERDDHVYRYQGNEYDVMIFEEATHYSAFQVSYLTGNRLRGTTPQVRPFVLYPSNPGNRGHAWYKRLFIERNHREGERPEDYAFVQAKVTDNAALLTRDPGYLDRLNKLPEPLRSQLRDGDWAAGAGMALQELNYDHHLVQPFSVPGHWVQFGAFDWGFAHPFSFGWYAQDEDGTIYKVDTVTGRGLLPHEIHDRIASRVPLDALKYIDAGHDLWNDIKARGETTPSLQEQFRDLGWKRIRKANISRKTGLNNFRRYVTWREGVPARFKLMDTPSNRRCFEQLLSMVVDPDDPEDALKVDADEFGEGGDDMYDETRYGLASKPLATKPPKVEEKPNRNVDRGLEKIVERKNQEQKRQEREIARLFRDINRGKR